MRQAQGSGHAVLSEIYGIAQETSAAMRDIVWLVRPSPGSVDDLLLRLREVAGRLLGEVEWHLETDSLPATLPLEVRRHVYLFAREALRNAAIHAQSHKVDLRFTCADHRLHFEIIDDGAGFSPEQATTGTGLASLRQRAAALRGEIQIDSAPAQGTRILLTVPLSKT
jgi:signal transduction histidine kinase